MDIEERAEKWAKEYARENFINSYDDAVSALIAAYLAGSAQTQHDYVKHYERKNNGYR